MNNLYYNNDLFDTKLIFSDPAQIEQFINNEIQEENDLTFDIIENFEQLIIPSYYSYLLEDVNISEINYFNDFLSRNFLPISEIDIDLQNQENLDKLENKTINKLINQIKYKKLPKEILIKYWLRIYSLQSEFFKNLNKSLRNSNNQAYFYYPFIKLCYEGIKKGFLKSNTQEIYRCSKISKNEFEQIKNKFNSNPNKNEFPKPIVFSRSFLSFTTDKEKAKLFRGSDSKTYCIMYIIQKINNIDDIENKVSNADTIFLIICDVLW